MMLGLGEHKEEVLATMQELATQGTDILTLGQYLQPTREHLPIVRYVHPNEFAEFKIRGEAMGFKHVEAGPLVRSSYHAFDQAEAAVRFESHPLRQLSFSFQSDSRMLKGH
jgi:lipoic acid synthetase